MQSDWLPWIVVAAVGFVFVGILLRMVLAARFPKGYGAWARQRREQFTQRSDQWDRDDEAFRK